VRFIKESQFGKANLAKLTGESREAPFCPHQSACELAGHLLRGRETESRELVRSAYLSGIALDFMADEVINPAMKIIGNQRSSGRIDVLEEHRATQICLASLYELKLSMESLNTGARPLALGGGGP